MTADSAKRDDRSLRRRINWRVSFGAIESYNPKIIRLHCVAHQRASPCLQF
jgi:hypothetical protein